MDERCRKDDLQPGAYVKDHTTLRMFEVAGEPGYQVKLIDVASPIDKPHIVQWLTASALKRLELVRHAPCLDDLATTEEWGSAG